MSTSAKYDIRLASVAFARILRSRLTTHRKRTRPYSWTSRRGTAGSVLRPPQRFGDSYRWPDGSWTQSG